MVRRSADDKGRRMIEQIYTNAKIVTADREFLGTMVVRDGSISELNEGRTTKSGAIDFEGDYLLPGFIELHTDNLEKHFTPRPGVRWPSSAAVVAHDAQIVAAGITTVFDALALGDIFEGSHRIKNLREMVDGIRDARDAGALKADHWLHLRCELSFASVLELYESMMDDPDVRIVSIMDHTPGQRQFVDVDKYRFYYIKKYGLTDTEFQEFLAARQADQAKYSALHRCAILEHARTRGHILASHDDATAEHVVESAADGMVIAEFPTTVEAARASHEHGLAVLMGGPNVVLGGSHSGNVAAHELAGHRVLDIISSDYVPSCLVQAPFALTEAHIGLDLPAAIALVSRNPARAAGLADRGEIATGLRADFLRVRKGDNLAIMCSAWREGARIV
jgi:alpha-D-ribose 1-methylphosphonate 5-triphosphate diphosphatase